jgi:hypothetical protein
MKLYLFTIALLHLFILAQAQVPDAILDAGGAIDSLRQNNAVVGILYFIVIVQAGVIVKLWLKINQVSNERIADLKERLKSEEDLRKEIQDIYSKIKTKD